MTQHERECLAFAARHIDHGYVAEVVYSDPKLAALVWC